MKLFGMGNKAAAAPETAPAQRRQSSKKTKKTKEPSSQGALYWDVINQSDEMVSSEFLMRRDAQKKREEMQEKSGSQEFMQIYE
jgi:hypothetical protein